MLAQDSPQAPQITGWLKQRKVLGLWSSKFFTLFGSLLYCTKDARSPLNTPELQITAQTHIEIPRSDKGTRFTVTTPGSEALLLEADSEATRIRWILALRSCTFDRLHYSMNDFTIISVIGRGCSGKVMLCEHKETHERFAIKSVRKSQLIQTNVVHTVMLERTILSKIDHPFIIRLKFAFQTLSKFYLGLEYGAGGELFYWVQRHGPLPLRVVRLHMAEIALALDYLHGMGIIYRDLKPENIVLDAEGHVKLTDVGLAKDLSPEGQTDTFCGTREYVAPEIVRHQRYGFAADWWATGIFLFELLRGTTPFAHENRARLFRNILEEEVVFPKHMDASIREYIEMVLVKTPAERAGFAELKNCRLFEGLNWADVLARRVDTGLAIPASHLQNFDCQFTQEQPYDSKGGNVWRSELKISGFSFAESSAIPRDDNESLSPIARRFDDDDPAEPRSWA
jgi:serine/threonine protein kinase